MTSKSILNLIIYFSLTNNIFGSNSSELGQQLIRAVKKKRTSIVKEILKQNPDVNFQDKNGYTALHWLAQSDARVNIAELIISHNADINIKDKKDATALRKAVENSSLKMVKILISKKADLNSVSGFTKNNVLHIIFNILCLKTRHEIMHELIDHGADINAETNQKETPLHTAIENHDTYAVRVLVQEWCNIDSKMDFYTGMPSYMAFTPLQLAVKCKFEDAVNILIDEPTRRKKFSKQLKEDFYKIRRIPGILVTIILQYMIDLENLETNDKLSIIKLKKRKIDQED